MEDKRGQRCELSRSGLYLGKGSAMAQEGLITIKSKFGPKETVSKLEAAVQTKGLTVFAHIDHAAGAAQAGLTLQPTDLLIFGSAKGGTPLMQQSQTAGIDLPLKALVWQDESGNTWLSYNDPARIARRHDLGEGAKPTVDVLGAVLKEIAAKATE
jgi:uncharacterized protein (DUF302 family)